MSHAADFEKAGLSYAILGFRRKCDCSTHKGYRAAQEQLDQLQPRPPLWTADIDNVAGQCALTKGYGNNGAVNGMVATVWGLAAAHGWAPHFERVPFADNISDALSRGDKSEAKRRGWTRVHTRQEEILHILYRAGTSTQYATASAPNELFNIAF